MLSSLQCLRSEAESTVFLTVFFEAFHSSHTEGKVFVTNSFLGRHQATMLHTPKFCSVLQGSGSISQSCSCNGIMGARERGQEEWHSMSKYVTKSNSFATRNPSLSFQLS